LNKAQQVKTGLALGSGGARGWAHIGALLELEAMGFTPCCIAGTSIGGIAGALHACGRTAIAAEMADDLNWAETARLFLELNVQRSGLLTGINFIKLLKKIIPAKKFEELKIPLAITATVLEDESEMVFREGDLFQALRAGIGIPGIFTTTPHNGRNLVDGGLKNPLPISICRVMGAEAVIAIDVNLGGAVEQNTCFRSAADGAEQRNNGGAEAEVARLAGAILALIPKRQTDFSSSIARWFGTPKKSISSSLSMFDVLTRSFRLIENEITRNIIRLNPPEVLIQPKVGDIMTLEFHRGPEAIAAGRAAVREKSEALEKLITGCGNKK
jgi:NTE family protein